MDILHIDDNGAEAFLFAEAIKSVDPDIRVNWKAGGEEALGYLVEPKDIAQDRPKLIVLDINMPGIDGFEMLSSIRNNVTLRKIPVVMLSSCDTPASRLRARELGAHLYLIKPMSFEKLVEQARTLVERWLTPLDKSSGARSAI